MGRNVRNIRRKPGSDRVSSPKTRLFPGRGGSVRQERSLNSIYLSRPGSTSCCMAFSGTTCAHTASDTVGRSSWKNCTLRRTVVEIWRGGDLLNPPQDLGGVCRSQMSEAAPARFILSSAWVLIKVCGEPVPKRATQPNCTATGPLCTLILVVKEESSIVTTPATRQCPYSASKGGR